MHSAVMRGARITTQREECRLTSSPSRMPPALSVFRSVATGNHIVSTSGALRESQLCVTAAEWRFGEPRKARKAQQGQTTDL